MGDACVHFRCICEKCKKLILFAVSFRESTSTPFGRFMAVLDNIVNILTHVFFQCIHLIIQYPPAVFLTPCRSCCCACAGWLKRLRIERAALSSYFVFGMQEQEKTACFARWNKEAAATVIRVLQLPLSGLGK